MSQDDYPDDDYPDMEEVNLFCQDKQGFVFKYVGPVHVYGTGEWILSSHEIVSVDDE